MLNNRTKQEIKELALKIPNEEICGLLIESGNYESFIPCKNISSNKSKHFEISPLDYLRIAENNKIIGIIHSQHSFLPSSLDIVNSLGHNLKSYIYSLDFDEFLEITEGHLKYKKYLGKIFEIGKQDCFTLIRDFYKQELNIEINNYPRNDNWYKENPNIIIENYQKEGFQEAEIKDIKHSDIIIFNSGHFGIYLDGDLLLHHQRNKLSNIERLTEEWKSFISNIYRFSS